MQFAPRTPRIAVHDVRAWRHPHPRLGRVGTPRRGPAEVQQKFPAVAKWRWPNRNKVLEIVHFSERSLGLKNAAGRAGQRVKPPACDLSFTLEDLIISDSH